MLKLKYNIINIKLYSVGRPRKVLVNHRSRSGSSVIGHRDVFITRVPVVSRYVLDVPLETKRLATPRHFGRCLYSHTRTNIELVTRTPDSVPYCAFTHTWDPLLCTYRNVVAQIVEVSLRLFHEFRAGIFWSKHPSSSSFFFHCYNGGAQRSLINHCSVYTTIQGLF